MTGIRVADPADVAAEELAPGVASRRVFDAGDATLVVNELDPGTAVPWHVVGRDVFAFVRAGRGRIEYGAGGDRAAPFAAGEFVHVPAGVVHRTVAVDGVEFVAALSGMGDLSPADPPGTDPDRPPRVAGPDDLVETVETPGVTREAAFPGEDVLLMRVRAPAGAEADWHHHGDNAYFGYVRDGYSETESADGVAAVEAGECFTVPPGLVHRDTNPTDEAHEAIIWLCGGEPWVVNVGEAPD